MKHSFVSRMAASWEIAVKALKVSLTYRFNTLFEILSVCMGFFIQLSIWQALYTGRSQVAGVDLADMTSYVLVTSCLSALTRSNIALKIAGQVKDGSVGNELLKPISYKTILMYDEIGRNIFNAVFIMLPPAILFGLLYRMRVAVAAPQLALFALSVVLGIVLIYSLNFIYGLLAFWLKTAEYVNFLSRAMMALFAGRTVPLWFYPSALRSVANALPFRFITFEPMQIFLGKLSLQQSAQVIAWQAGWIAILLLVQHLMWRGVQKHLVVQGG